MKTTSKISALITAIAVTGMLAFGGATTAYAQNVVAFDATANQLTLTSEVCNGSVCDLMFEGNGTVNIMGPVTVTIHVAQDFSGYPCFPAPSEATYVGATGSITVSDTCGTVCPSATRSGFPYTIQGGWNVTGGTGQFSGISGSGSDQGTINPQGHGPNVHLSGIVVY
jgi:hypothetical protein